ncbi:MAG: TolC family protein [Candidatus Hydrogenedentes bacterium]|nr:TolC family protein [Candidatus Hydrogenedentota bacterium]
MTIIALWFTCMLAQPEIEPSAFFVPNEELNDYLPEAGENNPMLRARFDEWLAALERILQVKSLDDPVFTYAPFLQSDTNNVRLILAQKFPWFGTLSTRRDKSLAEADAVLERFYAERNKVFADVKQTYFEYAFLGASIEVTEAQLEVLGYMEGIVQLKYSLGIATEGDLLRVQIEQTIVQDSKDGLERLRPASSALLSEAIGRSPAALLPWPQEAALPPPAPALEDAFALVHQANPELSAFDHIIESGQKQEKLSRKRGFPDFTLGLMYTQRSSTGGEDFLMPSLSVNVPIWRGKIKAGIQEARLRTNAARQSKRHRALALESAAQMALFGMEDGLRRYNLYRDSLLPKAEQTYRSLQTAYASGGTSTDFLDVLDSIRFLLNFQLDQLRAERDLHLAAADLEMLMGGRWVPD